MRVEASVDGNIEHTLRRKLRRDFQALGLARGALSDLLRCCGDGTAANGFTSPREDVGLKRKDRRRIQLCNPVGDFVNDQVSSVNFLYCHEDDQVGRERGRKMADTFNYLATQLTSVREVFPGRSYPSLGLLPQLRRQATGPEASEQAGEGLCLGGPERVMRALKRWEACGVDRVNFLLNAQEVIPQAEVLDSLRLFAREVMPAFAGSKPAAAGDR